MRLFRRTTTVELSWRGYRALRKGGWRSNVTVGLLILFGVLCFVPGVPELLSKQDGLNDWISEGALRLLCIFLGIGSMGLGVFRLRLRLLLFRSRGLIAQDDLSDALAVDAETFDAVVRNRNIQPRLVLNGRSFYKRSDFGDMPLLLRPSQAPPVGVDVLLRPIRGDQEVPTEHLLRPIADETLPVTVLGSAPSVAE